MWFLPTRNRPDAMVALIKSMRAVNDVPNVAVLIDGDPSLYRKVSWPAHWSIHIAKEHMELQKAFNYLFSFYPHEKTYGTLVDHCEVVSPGWSKKLEEAAGEWNIAFCDDERRFNQRTGFPRMNAATCYGAKLAHAMGYVYPDFCVHLAGDDAIEEIGWELGIIKIVPDTFVKALFFVKGEFAQDSNHDRIYQGKPYAQADMEAFAEWRLNDKPKLMAKLDALITLECRGQPLVAKEVKPVTFCCVQTNNYCDRGAEYVNNLYDMIRRNLPYGFVGKFVCFTDDPKGLTEGIEARPLPVPGIDGWWNKLALFKKGVFEEGERVWFFDLDTLILGPLDEIVQYQGDFATLRDFYHPSQVGPGIISWKVNETNCSIWNAWKASGFPQEGLGDLWWINNLDQGRFAHRAHKLQDLYPDKFVSYKVHCTPYPPKGSSVVCFHGQPKCHNTGVEWVENVWNVGGYTSLNVQTFCNVADSELKSNIRYSSSLNLPWLIEKKPNDLTAVIVGGGPSLKSDLGIIKTRQKSGHKIFALNGAEKILTENGIRVDFQIIMDAKPENISFVENSEADIFILASQVNKGLFDELKNRNVLLFHASIPFIRDLLPEAKRNTVVVGGGTTVLTRAMALIHFMGYRHQHLYGVDSSFKDNEHHAYKQLMNSDKPSEVMVGDRNFLSCPWMMAQVDEFQSVSRVLAQEDSVITVHGDGLLPYVASLMAA